MASKIRRPDRSQYRKGKGSLSCVLPKDIVGIGKWIRLWKRFASIGTSRRFRVLQRRFRSVNRRGQL